MHKTVTANCLGGREDSRGGSIILLVVFALLVVMCCLALVLDRLWLDSAVVELTRGAEAAALNAAQGLVSDDRLRVDRDAAAQIAMARTTATDIAAQNLVVGTPLLLEEGDIRFGQMIERSETGQTAFIETRNNPTSVIVTAHRSRGRGNPIALFFSRLTGQAAGSATARVVATIGKRVVGVRSFEDVHVPGLPMAILAKDVGCKRRDTWDIQIEQRQGQDRYSYDSQAEQVTSGPDGIPEIVLRTQAGSSAENVLLVDLGNNLRADVAARQIQDGLSIRELELVGGELRLDDLPKRLAADCMFSSRTLGALEGIIGQCRICLLYENFQPSMGRRYGHADCTRLIAGRVMDMQSCHQGMMEIIFQPGVIATRTALLADADGDPHSGSCEENRYIFKLCLTQ